MADAAVTFLLENIKQHLLYQAHLVGDAKKQVEQLENDLLFFEAFLNDLHKKRRKDDSLRELVREIRDVIYEAEDIIDAFVTQATETKSKSSSRRALQTPMKLFEIAKKVEMVRAKVRDINGDEAVSDFDSLDVGYRGPEVHKAPIARQGLGNIVGLDDESEMLRRYLTEETQQLDVISIIGMPGLGKTTLAVKIFHDPVILYEFPTRIWVNISLEFSMRDVFLTILQEFIPLTEDIYLSSNQDLAHLIARHLENIKFLIVMDDVWTTEDWDKLQIVLPKSNKKGKVLITSRNADVAQYASHFRNPHRLRFLNCDESWLLLQLEIFGKCGECPRELEVLGKEIAESCDGLPLALVVIGGILVNKSASKEMFAKRKAWENILQSVGKCLKEDPDRRMEKLISLSYDKLPFHLRACFLYFGMFPRDFKIPVWKLIRMWIAEGFIQEKADGTSLEETAENYLEDLISRNLVIIDKIKPNGKVKTCRIQEMLRDFCKHEAGNERENFFQEMKKSREGYFEPSLSDLDKCRRLCIHSYILNFLSKKPVGPHVRSFVCFSKEDINLTPEFCSTIPAAFKLLRVLDVKPIKFTKIPSDIYHLIHLRYLVLSFNLSILPSAFSKLGNIQTLIVDTACRTLEIKADIWKLIKLRYIKTNASAMLPKTIKTSTGCENLHTLSSISPQNCTEEVFDRLGKLKKLSIRGRLSYLMDGKAGSFDSLGRLNNLENLKLLNDVYPSVPSEGRLHGLPQPYKFPPKLKSLTLADTFLDWSQMSVLGLLESLQVLKLKDKAFMGQLWMVSDGGFRNLEVLHIGHTDLVNWEASGHHFPKLRWLELQNCEKLKEVPLGLADIPSLELLKLYRSTLAAASANKIHKAKQMKQAEQTTKIGVFSLFIYPPV